MLRQAQLDAELNFKCSRSICLDPMAVSRYRHQYSREMVTNGGIPLGAPTPRLVLITPEMAIALLSRALVNRRLDQGQVDFLADSILREEWQLTHQGIALDGSLETGLLLDGQHRLNAIVKAGVPVWIYVFEGLARAAFPVLDTGKRRSGVDTLSATGEKYIPLLHSTIRHVLLFKNMRDSSWSGNGSRIANGRILAAYNEDSDMYREAVATGREISKHVFASQSGAAVGYFVTTEAAPAVEASSWIDGLISGANLKVGDPRLALVKVPHVKRRGTRRRYTMREQVAIYVKAWNAWVQGEEIEKLSFRKTEKMPIPVEVKFDR